VRNISSLVRPVITLMLVIIFCGLVILGRPVPEVFSTLVISVVGYWFGERSKGK
jgi:hypothetical protein